MRKSNTYVVSLAAMLCAISCKSFAADSFTLGLNNMQSAAETAATWQPIIEYVKKKTGVTLQIRQGQTAAETDSMTAKGEFDFLVDNHNFAPDLDVAGYKPVAQLTNKLSALIVASAKTGIKSIKSIRPETKVGFSYRGALVAFALPCSALKEAGVEFTPEFPSNPSQQALGTLLKNGNVDAAAFTKSFFSKFVTTEIAAKDFPIIWESPTYPNWALSANPRVPKKKVNVVAKAFIGMTSDPEGRKILKQVESKGIKGFEHASDADFDGVRALYKNNRCKDIQ